LSELLEISHSISISLGKLNWIFGLETFAKSVELKSISYPILGELRYV